MPQVLQLESRNFNNGNWKIFHPNGKHMFTCSEKKAMWYVEKGLGELQDDPNCVTLTFEPKGYGYEEGEIFGIAGRKIMCVVTGESEGLQRHHIVPYCYRSHFPDEYKSKNHHDVVLVTYKIHEEYERHASVYKNEMARIYGVPTLNELNLEYTKLLSQYSSDKVKMLSRFHSIFKNYENMPQETIKEILYVVSKYTDISKQRMLKLNFIQLYKLYLLLRKYHEKEFETYKDENKHRYDHGYHVVSKLDTHEKLEEFVKMWRTHFIETMKPPYMPDGWRVDFRVKVEL